MLTFMTAYLVVWFAVLAYVLRLGGEQRRLRRTAEALQAQFEKQRPPRTTGRMSMKLRLAMNMACRSWTFQGLSDDKLAPCEIGKRATYCRPILSGSIEGRTMKIACILFCCPGGRHACMPAVPAVAGTIEGTVVNTSSGTPVPCQVAVILQVQVKSQFVPFREAISDKQGRFRFERLPVGDGVVYLAGATRHGIFYPGPRIRLTDLQPIARTELSVCDAVAGPSPLVLKKMDVTIRPETGLLKVTESLLMENPSHTCYVGEAAHDGADPVTLELSIPPDFERTTFDQEFFGRRFAVVNNKVVTSIPWPPGERELRYTYVLRNTQEVSRGSGPWTCPVPT